MKVLISFYLVVTDDSSSSARTSPIYKDRSPCQREFNVPLSGDEPIDLSNIVKHLKSLTGLAEIAKSKGLGEKLEAMIVISCSFIILRYQQLRSRGLFPSQRKGPGNNVEVQKAISFLQEPLKSRINSKYQLKGSIYTLHLLSFVEFRLLNVIWWERKWDWG